MKRYFLLNIILALMMATGLFGFIDQREETREKILRKLDELKYIRGMLRSGRGKIFVDAAEGEGTLFDNTSIVKNYHHMIQLDINMLARPVDIIETGVEARFQTDLSGKPWTDDGKNISLRDIFAQGILFEFIKIRFGTLYERFTPFTLYAPLDLIPMRSELFYSYYIESLYDNMLHHKNDFPLNGISMNMEFLIPDMDGTWGIKGLTGKLGSAQDEIGNSFDRYLYGVDTYLIIGKTAKF